MRRLAGIAVIAAGCANAATHAHDGALWLFAYVATCAVELAAVRVVLPRARVSIVLAARTATDPAVWLAISVLPGAVIVRLAVVEVWVVLVEASIYARWLRLPGHVALALSAAANAASLLVLSLV